MMINELIWCIYSILGDCNFQTSLTTSDCLWNNVKQGDDFDWIANSGRTGSFYTGPSADRKGTSSGMSDVVILRIITQCSIFRQHIVFKTYSSSKCKQINRLFTFGL